MTYIIGSDEVGYGAWAGPLFVCAVAVSENWKPPAGLTDSKALEPHERATLYHFMQNLPMAIMVASNDDIDAVGAKKALLDCHSAAINSLLKAYPDAAIIVDGVLRPPGLPERAQCIKEADALFPVVSAASVIAKVNRDFVMGQYHEQFPHYGWNTNMGYGGGRSHAHTRGLDAYGVTPLHRKSYSPIKKRLEALCASKPT